MLDVKGCAKRYLSIAQMVENPLKLTDYQNLANGVMTASRYAIMDCFHGRQLTVQNILKSTKISHFGALTAGGFCLTKPPAVRASK